MKEPPALVGQAFLYCCGDRFSPAQLCADQRSGHSRARGPGRGGGGLVVRRATRSQGLDGVRGGRGRQGPAAGCSLGLGPPRAVPGAQPGPRSADVLFCSPDLAPLLGRGLMRERGNQNPEIAGPLQGTLLPGGGAGAEEQSSVADWEVGKGPGW